MRPSGAFAATMTPLRGRAARELEDVPCQAVSMRTSLNMAERKLPFVVNADLAFQTVHSFQRARASSLRTRSA